MAKINKERRPHFKQAAVPGSNIFSPVLIVSFCNRWFMFQLCFVDYGIAHGEELERLKTLHSIRHNL